MDSIIKGKNSLYSRYEELLLRRDQVEREAGSIMISYLQEFGALTTDVFREKVECIRLKKAIAFCQRAVNQGEQLDTEALNAYLKKNMAMYYAELKKMMEDRDRARSAGNISAADMERAKRLYRRLAKQIHPDINPLTRENERLQDLWNRIVIAYHMGEPAELEELEVLVGNALRELGAGQQEITIPNIEERILRLEEEINEILTTEPYTFAELLEDEQAVEEKKAELQKELETYKAYHKELDAVLEKLVIEGGTGIIWKMN